MHKLDTSVKGMKVKAVLDVKICNIPPPLTSHRTGLVGFGAIFILSIYLSAVVGRLSLLIEIEWSQPNSFEI